MTQRKKDGRLVTVACPSDSKVCQLPSVVEVIGTAEVPLFPWSVVRTDDCQFGPATSGAGWFWISNLDLSAFSLPCKKPDALVSPVHSHLPKQQGPGGEGHPQACCEAYWACVGPQLPFRTPVTESVGLPQRAKDGGSGLRFRDQIASVALEKEKAGENIEVPKSDVDVSRELTAAEREALDKELEELSARMDKLWKERADSGNWEEVKADLGVYRLSGEVVTVDPRRAESYRQQVVEGLGFGSEAAVRHPDLTADDVAACREVLSRKAAGFWLEGTPRTTVRNVAHDCVPTGPPVSLQPHALKGESAAWVDERLEEEVARGQLVRGSSAWGSPPFPTKEAPAHKKMRKRRLVVDYRRVNARVLRSTYYCRKASDVLAQCAGSVWYSFVDAVTGFNQIANTRRAMEVLAIVARSGKFLPVCLTFGPVNGPDDFCYVVDRAFGPGRGRRARFAREWVAYIDDLTVRTGRAIDGQYLTDAEYEEEVKRAMREGPVEVPQVTGEALEALGIKPKSLGAEKAEKKKHDERVSDHNHPTRSKGSFRLWARDSKFLSRSRTRTTALLTVWVLGKVVVYLGPPTEFHRPPASSSPLCCVSTLVSPQPFGFLGAQCLGREQAEGRALKARKKFDRRGSRLCKPRGLAGLRCVSPAGRGPMGKKGGHRRDPRSNWDDLEYMLTRGLRHGDYGFRGHLSDQGRVSVRFAADQFGVSEQDIESVVSWQHGKQRLATDTDHSGRVWIRALQGHSSDSGLSKASFQTSAEADNLRDDQELMHGTFKQRVEDIISSGALKAEGAGRPGEGRLFVHEAGRISGIRKGCDTAFVARVGTLRAAGVTLLSGTAGVVLTDNISVDLQQGRLLRPSHWEVRRWDLDPRPRLHRSSPSDRWLRIIGRRARSQGGRSQGRVELHGVRFSGRGSAAARGCFLIGHRSRSRTAGRDPAGRACAFAARPRVSRGSSFACWPCKSTRADGLGRRRRRRTGSAVGRACCRRGTSPRAGAD